MNLVQFFSVLPGKETHPCLENRHAGTMVLTLVVVITNEGIGSQT